MAKETEKAELTKHEPVRDWSNKEYTTSNISCGTVPDDHPYKNIRWKVLVPIIPQDKIAAVLETDAGQDMNNFVTEKFGLGLIDVLVKVSSQAAVAPDFAGEFYQAKSASRKADVDSDGNEITEDHPLYKHPKNPDKVHENLQALMDNFRFGRKAEPSELTQMKRIAAEAKADDISMDEIQAAIAKLKAAKAKAKKK